MDNKDKELKNDIKDSLTCFICLEKLNNPLICPKCRRLGCSSCLSKWFSENNHNCPYCKNKMNLDEMILLPFGNNLYDYFYSVVDKDDEKKQNETQNQNVNLNEIIDEESDEDNELDNQLSKTQIIPDNKNNINEIWKNNISKSFVRNGSKCPKHPTQNLEYICLDCDTKHCSKCLMITNKDFKIHEKHSIISIEKYKTYNIKELMNITKNFPDLTKILNNYNNKITTEIEICNKEEEIYNNIKNKIQNIFDNKIQKTKNNLINKNSEINSKIEEITNISMTSKDAIQNFIKRKDFSGLKEYYEQITRINNEINNMSKLNFGKENKKPLKTKFNLYESEFAEVEINKNNNEVYGEMQIQIGNKNYQIKVIPDGEKSVSFNFLIEKEENTDYYAYCIIKDKDNIYLLELDQKMKQDNFVILAKYIPKNQFINFINIGNKCKIKFIVSSIYS